MLSKLDLLPNPSPLRMLLPLLLSGLLLSGCASVNIQNISDLNVRVAVKAPDSSHSQTRSIAAQESEEVFSSHGGVYTVTLLPDQEYISLLKTLREEISRRLFQEGETLSSQEVARLVDRLDQIDQLVDEAARMSAGCSGSVLDFESASVVIYYSEEGSLKLTCR